MDERLASPSKGMVRFSVDQAMATCTKAPAKVMRPNQGLMSDTKTKKTSAAGASNMAVTAPEEMNSRKVRRSVKACVEPPGTRRKLAVKAASNRRSRRVWSTPSPAR